MKSVGEEAWRKLPPNIRKDVKRLMQAGMVDEAVALLRHAGVGMMQSVTILSKRFGFELGSTAKMAVLGSPAWRAEAEVHARLVEEAFAFLDQEYGQEEGAEPEAISPWMRLPQALRGRR